MDTQHTSSGESNERGAIVLALRRKEAAAALGISERKLWELTNRGIVPCVRFDTIVTYPLAALEQMLADQTEGGANHE